MSGAEMTVISEIINNRIDISYNGNGCCCEWYAFTNWMLVKSNIAFDAGFTPIPAFLLDGEGELVLSL